jgi:carboxylate-amine ligase
MGRSFGVEEEIHLVDTETSALASRAPQVLAALPDHGYSAELQRSTVETNTEVCHTLDELREAVVERRMTVVDAAEHLGVAVFAAGTAPLQTAADFDLTLGGRFSRMQQDYRLLLDEHLVCGVQVHVGVDDRDLAVRILPRLEAALPILLALSSSSPFWRGRDSGYASFRTTLWQRWPTAGRSPDVASYAQYLRLIDTLIGGGTISDPQMVYFDVRPSPHLPTLELRVCDACPVVDDVVLIAALFRAAVAQAVRAETAGMERIRVPEALYRAGMWRAARSGLSGELLDQFTEAVPAWIAVSRLVDRLRPDLEEAGDWEAVGELSQAALARGSSSERQRARYGRQGELGDVVALLVAETKGQETVTAGVAPGWVSGYRATSTDEAVGPSGIPVPRYESIFAAFESLQPVERSRRAMDIQTEAARQELTFGVGGRQSPVPVDGFPRVISAHEWQILTDGLTQRARALEAYLRDAYGAAAIVADGVMAPDAPQRWHGWRPEGRLLPEGTMRAAVMGFDLVRDEAVGGWRVLEDNVRVPSGVAYAIAMRRLTRLAVPELPTLPLRNPDTVPGLLCRTLQGCTDVGDPTVALLSEGADNSAWFEHRLLADEAGLLLANPRDVDVTDDRVTVGGRPVDVLYLRLEAELLDLTGEDDRPIGAEVFELATQGRVVVVNAPGNGIADDKAAYCHVPDLVTYYLGERPLLAQVPTYRCADPSERGLVLDRLDELVTKPVGGYGGSGVLIGPDASADQLMRRQREILAEPNGWVAQETVSLSTVPTLVGNRLEARHVDLRAFVYLTGTAEGQAHLADLALTRVAPAGTMVVNSSRGGGTKDTWILTGVEEPAD